MGTVRALDAGVLGLDRLIELIRGVDLAQFEKVWDNALKVVKSQNK